MILEHHYKKNDRNFVWPGGYVSDYVVTIVNPNEAGEVEDEDGHYEGEGDFHIKFIDQGTSLFDSLVHFIFQTLKIRTIQYYI